MKSVVRVSQILRCFNEENPLLSLADLERSSGLDKATLHRYVGALCAEGILTRETENGLYHIGADIVRLSTVLLGSFKIQDRAAPIMRKLTRELDLSSVLSVWIEDSPVVVRCESAVAYHVRQEIVVGTRLPLNGPTGRVFVAFDSISRSGGAMSQQEVARALKSRTVMAADVAPGISAIATPVLNGRALSAVLTVFGTTRSLSGPVTAKVTRALRRSAEELGSRETLK